ncbi:MAG: hypothetical protein IIA62_01930 [Nitrospinae bacterium]|nr:hypothetical protein [Nitrospinota bacterium]
MGIALFSGLVGIIFLGTIKKGFFNVLNPLLEILEIHDTNLKQIELEIQNLQRSLARLEEKNLEIDDG